MNHGIRMLLGCLLPVVLLFVLPAVGVSAGVTLTIAISLMVLCHLMMLRDHGHAPGEPSEHHRHPQ